MDNEGYSSTKFEDDRNFGISQAQNGTQCGETVLIRKPDEKINDRLNILVEHFRSRFHLDPSFVVRVPGRVNLIGEHVDYCGYSVCPMAIEQDVLVAVRKSSNDASLRLTNVDKKYPDYQHDNLQEIRDVRLDDHDLGPAWHKYFLCGVKSALEAIPEERIPRGLVAAVSGNIPPNAGLSSSSALVSAALLAAVHASQHKMTKVDMATISAKGERYIGTQGGGMDQAIAFLGKSGSAKLIEFNPLRGFDVTLPEDAVFVIAHSLADHNKASISDFNTRVLECRLAAQVIAKKYGADWTRVKKLIDIQNQLNKTLDEMASIAAANLHEEPYTWREDDIQVPKHEKLERRLKKAIYQPLKRYGPISEAKWHSGQLVHRSDRYRECCILLIALLHRNLKLGALQIYTGQICDILNSTVEQLKAISNVPHNTSRKLKLRQRALHVFQEAGRVAAFRSICERRELSSVERLLQLGSLMSKSHASLQSLYECSHPRIDALIATALQYGALGARLTGAGWGGCIVAMIHNDNVHEFMNNIKKEFYQNDEKAKGLDLSKFVFQTEPKEGATIYSID